MSSRHSGLQGDAEFSRHDVSAAGVFCDMHAEVANAVAAADQLDSNIQSLSQHWQRAVLHLVAQHSQLCWPAMHTTHTDVSWQWKRHACSGKLIYLQRSRA